MKLKSLTLTFFTLCIATVATTKAASAATLSVIADGLNNPRNFDFAPDGSIYLTESGSGGDGKDGSCVPSYKNYADPVKAKAMEATIEYVLTEGQKISGELGYIPLPQAVVEKVAAAADQISPDYQISVSGSGSSASK